MAPMSPLNSPTFFVCTSIVYAKNTVCRYYYASWLTQHNKGLTLSLLYLPDQRFAQRERACDTRRVVDEDQEALLRPARLGRPDHHQSARRRQGQIRPTVEVVHGPHYLVPSEVRPESSHRRHQRSTRLFPGHMTFR